MRKMLEHSFKAVVQDGKAISGGWGAVKWRVGLGGCRSAACLRPMGPTEVGRRAGRAGQVGRQH